MSKRNRNKKKLMKYPGGYLTIPRYVIETEAFKSLGPNSCLLLMLLAANYKGNNNGDLCASKSLMKGYIKSTQTLFKARQELEQKGFIAINCYGGRSYGGAKFPTLYALTWLPIDDFVNPEKNLFRYAHLPLGKVLKYFLKGVNPRYKNPKAKRRQYQKDVKLKT